MLYVSSIKLFKYLATYGTFTIFLNCEETRAELSQIVSVIRQIISPQANKPVMCIVQDTLCGIRKFTLRDTFLDWNAVQNILLWVPDWTVPFPYQPS